MSGGDVIDHQEVDDLSGTEDEEEDEDDNRFQKPGQRDVFHEQRML